MTQLVYKYKQYVHVGILYQNTQAEAFVKFSQLQLLAQAWFYMFTYSIYDEFTALVFKIFSPLYESRAMVLLHYWKLDH